MPSQRVCKLAKTVEWPPHVRMGGDFECNNHIDSA